MKNTSLVATLEMCLVFVVQSNFAHLAKLQRKKFVPSMYKIRSAVRVF